MLSSQERLTHLSVMKTDWRSNRYGVHFVTVEKRFVFTEPTTNAEFVGYASSPTRDRIANGGQRDSFSNVRLHKVAQHPKRNRSGANYS
jgi:hypothetical protein